MSAPDENVTDWNAKRPSSTFVNESSQNFKRTFSLKFMVTVVAVWLLTLVICASVAWSNASNARQWAAHADRVEQELADAAALNEQFAQVHDEREEMAQAVDEIVSEYRHALNVSEQDVRELERLLAEAVNSEAFESDYRIHQQVNAEEHFAFAQAYETNIRSIYTCIEHQHRLLTLALAEMPLDEMMTSTVMDECETAVETLVRETTR